MNYHPDLNRIGDVIHSWAMGVLADHEARERIEAALEPEHFLPESELVPERASGFDVARLHGALHKLDAKLDLLLDALDISLADAIPPNPDALCYEAKQLAERGAKINAIRVHRNRTGAGLAESYALVNQYLEHRKRPR